MFIRCDESIILQQDWNHEVFFAWKMAKGTRTKWPIHCLIKFLFLNEKNSPFICAKRKRLGQPNGMTASSQVYISNDALHAIPALQARLRCIIRNANLPNCRPSFRTISDSSFRSVQTSLRCTKVFKTVKENLIFDNFADRRISPKRRGKKGNFTTLMKFY